MKRSQILLKVKDVGKNKADRSILAKINFDQSQRERIAIVGETGSGKTTLLRIISGLIQPDSGTVLLNDAKVLGPEEQLVPGHPSIAYLSQHFELQKFLKVHQVLQYANGLNEKEAQAIYKVCEVDHLLQRKTDELSGGEKQRIAIARLLVGKPLLLLLDEPFSNLDFIHKNILKGVLAAISDKLKITCLMVSHDPIDTLPWADRIFVMKEGRIIQEGTSRKVYHEPVNEYAAGLFGTYNKLTPSQVKVLKWKGNGKPIIRPEQIELSLRKSRAQGVIEKVNYYGSYCEYEIQFMRGTLFVNATEAFKAGDKVSLKVKS